MKLLGFFVVFVLVVVEIAFCKLDESEEPINGIKLSFTIYLLFLVV